MGQPSDYTEFTKRPLPDLSDDLTITNNERLYDVRRTSRRDSLVNA